jgi:hypothetical protein
MESFILRLTIICLVCGLKKKNRLTGFGLMLSAMAVCSLFVVASASITVQSSLTTSGSITLNISIGRQTYASWGYSTQTVTENFDLYIGHWNVINDLLIPAKNARSDFKSFLYFNSLYRYNDTYNDPSGSFTTFLSNGWLLKDSNGHYVNTGVEYLLDFGNPSVWAWYANWLNNYVNNPTNPLDGVQMDNFCVDKASAFYYSPTQNIINPRTGTFWTDAEVLQAYIGFVSAIKNTLGQSKIVLGNGIYNGDSNHFNTTVIQQVISQSGIDGFISEGWMGNSQTLSWPAESSWINSVNMAMWVQDNLLSVRSKGIFMPITGCASTNPDYAIGNLNGVPANQYTTYVYASLLLALKHSGNYLYFGTTDSYSQNLFKINIGAPVSDYTLINSTHVYSRNFTSGKVLVNPTASSYQVTIGNGFFDATTGVAVNSQVTISAHSGLILSK